LPLKAVTGGAGANGTLLLVDSEEMFRTAIGEALRRRGFLVLLAGEGQPALDLFHAHSKEITAVVLDLTLPDVRNGEVLSRIRKVRLDVRIVLTGPPGAAGSGDSNAVFLRTPYRVNELVGKLRQSDAGRTAADAAGAGRKGLRR
jgi:ActR/RegA family two-component response regulator